MSKLIHNNEVLKERRKELRKNQTNTEEILWFELRHEKLGFKFKDNTVSEAIFLIFIVHRKN